MNHIIRRGQNKIKKKESDIPPDKKAVITDIGNVLIYFDPMITCRGIAEYCGSSPNRIFEVLYSNGLFTKFETGNLLSNGEYAGKSREQRDELSSQKFFEAVKGQLNAKELEYDTFYALWQNATGVNTELVNMYRGMQRAGYRIVALSDTNPLHVKQFMSDPRYRFLRGFNGHVFSYQQGFTKPIPMLMNEACKRADCSIEECVYVDDKPEFVEEYSKYPGVSSYQFVGDNKCIEDFFRTSGFRF